MLENTQRDNLNPLELALSLRQAMDKKLYSNLEELSQSLGKSKSYVSKVMKVLHLEEVIIEDLSKNKSTNDIEALYEIQKIKDTKEQVRVYFDFLSKKLNRKSLRELNKKEKVSHTKIPYSFEGRAKKVKVEFDVSTLNDEKIKEIKGEIEEVLKRYFI